MSAVGYVVKAMSVKIDGTEYSCAVTGVTEQPSSTTVSTETACSTGDRTKQDTGPVSWAVQIDYNVSNLPTSLHRLLRDHAGEAATLVIEPFPVDEPGTLITYNVILTPAGAAMPVSQYANASVVLPCTAYPEFTDPV